MSSWLPEPSQRPLRRVRHEVRDGIAVVCSSIAVCTAFAVALTVVAKLAG
jgi:MFS superfamily sulfate permease-like transporter